MSGRPRLERLSAGECNRLLAGCTLGRVSVTMSALPVIRTVRYALALGHVVFRVAPGSRLRAAAANSVIAFHADCGGDGDVGWSVLVQGFCEEVTDPKLIEELSGLDLPAWSLDNDTFMRLPLIQISGELIHW